MALPNLSEGRACGECRRRHEKCSLEYPRCSNCQNRSPMPQCDYSREGDGGAGAGGGAAAASEMPFALDADPALDTTNPGAEPEASRTREGNHAMSVALKEVTRLREQVQAAAGDQWHQGGPQGQLRYLIAVLDQDYELAHRIIVLGWRMQSGMVVPSPSGPVYHMLQPGLTTGMTNMNRILLQVYLQVLAYFKVSITGTPSPQCRFTHWWLHLITKDPLLRHVAIYTASWFLWEQGAVARDVVEEHRGPLMLELELDPTVRYCYDVTVLAVAQMALNAWYWDDEGEPETHMNGLMEKLRWRGGLQTSGSHGFLSKMILVIDIAMALEGEREPWIYGRPGFDFEDDERPVLLRATYNSPLILDGPEFSVRADSWLGFYLATASVLDSLRALLRAVLDARAAGQSTTAIQRDAARMTGMLEARERESHAAASTASSKPTSPTQGGGPIDRTIRLAAMLHSRAIAARMPLSGVCSSAEAASLWAAFRSADMASWERLGGVCVWVLVVVAAAGGAGSGFQRTARMLLLPGLNAIAMEDWRAGMMAVGTALEIQEWLRDGDGSGGGGDDGE